MNYQKQATDFLTKHGIKFSAKFIEYGQHFDGDKESRDIFRLTLSRNGLRVSFRFGQSINSSTGDGSNPPTPYDLLSCIERYVPDSFEDFCSEFGYDSDSRKAEKTYRNVVKEAKKVQSFFSQGEIEELQEIQ